MMWRNFYGRFIPGVAALVFATLLWAPAAPAQKANADDCTLSVAAIWLDDFTATATTAGECGSGELALVVRNATDEVVWSASYLPKDLFGFEEVSTAGAMNTALTDWITTNSMTASTSDLAEWHEGDDGPEALEFPFYPAEDVVRDFYEMARELDLPMLCYIQGRESAACVFQMPDASVLGLLGYQSFPG